MRVFLFLFLTAAPIAAQEIQLPKEVRGEPTAFIRVTAQTSLPQVKWLAVDPGLNLFPVELLKDSKTAVVTAPKAGRYRLLAVAAKDSTPTDPVFVEVIVGDAPAPGPTPPTPGPTPPAPTPEDPFLKAVQAAYELERGDTKDGFRLHLIEVYKQAQATLNEPIQVIGLFTRMREHALRGIPDSEFRQVRLAISQELDKHLPRSVNAAVDASNREVFMTQFKRVVAVLEGLK